MFRSPLLRSSCCRPQKDGSERCRMHRRLLNLRHRVGRNREGSSGGPWRYQAGLVPYTVISAMFGHLLGMRCDGDRRCDPNPILHRLIWQVHGARACAEALPRARSPSVLQNRKQPHSILCPGRGTTERVSPTWTLRCAKRSRGSMTPALLPIFVILRVLFIRML